ncbi:Protein kinase domain [Dillenia turbinata]|uniref:mitogen-activated protein kinase kinase kinase n=1 Tax=Dillenia turbinata TaxID=194707 RepID=A0AAN8Z025_9MAGN
MYWTRGHIIGRGSSATVYAATSSQSGEVYAVKSVKLSKSEPLQREGRILSSLSSPYVVGYKGCDITKENNLFMYNLLMECVPGGTLSQEIRRKGGRLDESRIGFYTSQILKGLDYLHSNGFVHCDIKGANVLVSENGAKIGDMGCAKRVNLVANDLDHAAEPIGGTPAFMAPEVARGEEQGFPADIWSLGCTVIEMATGGSLWPGLTDPVSVLYHVGFSGEGPEIPNWLSGEAKDFLGKCLRRDPKERWTASHLLKHKFLRELELISNGKEIQESYSNSPTSILDQGIWNSCSLGESGVQDSPEKRIQRLELCSGNASWTFDENWVTIRCNNNENIEVEAESCSGSVSDSIIVDNLTELRSCGVAEESWVNLLGRGNSGRFVGDEAISMWFMTQFLTHYS